MSDTCRLEAEWKAVVEGDREAFNRLVAPLIPRLEAAARQEIRSFEEMDELPQGLYEAEDIVAEAVLRAWRNRRRRPAHLRLEAWLLAIIYRIVDDIVAQEARRRSIASHAGELHPEIPPFEDENEFWDWFQPADLPLAEPLMPEELPTPEEVAEMLERRPRVLAVQARRALWMHRRHGMEIEEIGSVLGRTPEKTRSLIKQAGMELRAEAEAVRR